MIKLNKGERPQVLCENADAWRDELLGYIYRGEKIPSTLANKYNHPEVKASLQEETQSKCMYCESKVSHVSYEHIEHIKPKAKDKFPELTYDWNNLGLACPICNMGKGDEYDPSLPILNPYVDTLDTYLVAWGSFVFGKPGEVRGLLTEKLLKLNRPELLERRAERIDTIRQLMDTYEREQHHLLKKIVYKELMKELERDKPYSFVINSMVDTIGLEAP